MKRISNLLSGYVRTSNLAAVIILTLVIVVGGREVQVPVKRVINNVFYNPFAQIKETVGRLYETAEANRRLDLALREATRRLELYEEIARENERLRGIHDFEAPPPYELLQARVISVYGTPIPISASINRGRVDSVTVNMAVINQEGLIGRVIAVSEDEATVQLLTDPTNRVAARLIESREMGIVKYEGRGGMVLDNVPVEGNVLIGDSVKSSGMGRTYPPTLTIGTVKDVVKPDKEPFYEIKLEPAANFNTIEEVFILRVSER